MEKEVTYETHHTPNKALQFPSSQPDKTRGVLGLRYVASGRMNTARAPRPNRIGNAVTSKGSLSVPVDGATVFPSKPSASGTGGFPPKSQVTALTAAACAGLLFRDDSFLNISSSGSSLRSSSGQLSGASGGSGSVGPGIVASSGQAPAVSTPCTSLSSDISLNSIIQTPATAVDTQDLIFSGVRLLCKDDSALSLSGVSLASLGSLSRSAMNLLVQAEETVEDAVLYDHDTVLPMDQSQRGQCLTASSRPQEGDQHMSRVKMDHEHGIVGKKGDELEPPSLPESGKQDSNLDSSFDPAQHQSRFPLIIPSLSQTIDVPRGDLQFPGSGPDVLQSSNLDSSFDEAQRQGGMPLLVASLPTTTGIPGEGTPFPSSGSSILHSSNVATGTYWESGGVSSLSIGVNGGSAPLPPKAAPGQEPHLEMGPSTPLVQDQDPEMTLLNSQPTDGSPRNMQQLGGTTRLETNPDMQGNSGHGESGSHSRAGRIIRKVMKPADSARNIFRSFRIRQGRTPATDEGVGSAGGSGTSANSSTSQKESLTGEVNEENGSSRHGRWGKFRSSLARAHPDDGNPQTRTPRSADGPSSLRRSGSISGLGARIIAGAWQRGGNSRGQREKAPSDLGTELLALDNSGQGLSNEGSLQSMTEVRMGEGVERYPNLVAATTSPAATNLTPAQVSLSPLIPGMQLGFPLSIFENDGLDQGGVANSDSCILDTASQQLQLQVPSPLPGNVPKSSTVDNWSYKLPSADVGQELEERGATGAVWMSTGLQEEGSGQSLAATGGSGMCAISPLPMRGSGPTFHGKAQQHAFAGCVRTSTKVHNNMDEKTIDFEHSVSQTPTTKHLPACAWWATEHGRQPTTSWEEGWASTTSMVAAEAVAQVAAGVGSLVSEAAVTGGTIVGGVAGEVTASTGLRVLRPDPGGGSIGWKDPVSYNGSDGGWTNLQDPKTVQTGRTASQPPPPSQVVSMPPQFLDQVMPLGPMPHSRPFSEGEM
ncbi:unnamed protein product, partial [Choristocarpus tenellus]